MLSKYLSRQSQTQCTTGINIIGFDVFVCFPTLAFSASEKKIQPKIWASQGRPNCGWSFRFGDTPWLIFSLGLITRRHANNSGNVPGPCPIAPRDEISRSGNPSLRSKVLAMLLASLPVSGAEAHVLLLWMKFSGSAHAADP